MLLIVQLFWIFPVTIQRVIYLCYQMLLSNLLILPALQKHVLFLLSEYLFVLANILV